MPPPPRQWWPPESLREATWSTFILLHSFVIIFPECQPRVVSTRYRHRAFGQDHTGHREMARALEQLYDGRKPTIPGALVLAFNTLDLPRDQLCENILSVDHTHFADGLYDGPY